MKIVFVIAGIVASPVPSSAPVRERRYLVVRNHHYDDYYGETTTNSPSEISTSGPLTPAPFQWAPEELHTRWCDARSPGESVWWEAAKEIFTKDLKTITSIIDVSKTSESCY